MATLTTAHSGTTSPADLRADFPLLDQTVNGHPLVYLDSAATAQRPQVVLDAELEFLEKRNAAVHRGAHTLAAEATEEFEGAREAVARFVGARADEIAWQSNATDALNTIAFAIGTASRGRGGEGARRFALQPGDELVVTEAEHHANLIPWQELAAQTGAVLRYVPVDEDGLWTIDELRAVVTEKTRLIAFAHVSNVTGMVAPVAEVVRVAASVGALTVLDACQSAPHRPLELGALGVDFAAFSAHKMLGPTGLGVLYGKRELLNALPPGRTGGSMITTVTMDHAEFLPAPQRFEAGTQPVSQAVALGAAVGYLTDAGVPAILDHEHALAARLYDGLSSIPGLRLIGPGAGVERAGLVSFDVAGVHAHDAGQYLDSRGIAVRVGHHCAQPLHRRLGLTASVRASVYLYNTVDDVDVFLEAAAGIRPYFGL
ncbi:SufS family cysteine desulfurase [Gryllotalpicola protaetiae]|uniref:Cysteine desulfurase n=1 Tax=Gryllotalpicola protaetiae TaxID=2419771 RepID=A0A387C2H1_9MICO|nr:SufS family cysteine desulfurase [Gryllotalpicola protaetiae]AYG04721.1 SufS family cysteine desulfurase [Gryllotalpicola protaetiae]